MRAGRPTSLTPEVHATIIEAIRGGNYRTTAAALAGVHRNSILGWIARGEAGEEPYASFAADMEMAEAKAESDLLATIRTAQGGIPGQQGAEPWQSRAWMLERRWPSRWSGRVRVTVEETIEEMLRRVAAVLDADNLEKVRLATRPDPTASSAADQRH